MNLRKKAFLTTVLVSSISLLFMLITSHTFILASFLSLENQDTEVQIGRATNGIHGEIRNLDIFVNDYATWDDSYEFITNNNTKYIESNLMDETFLHSHLNLMIFLDSSGELTFAKTYDLLHTTDSSVLRDFADTLSKNPSLWNFSSPEDSKSGLMCTSETMFIVASRPIITSQAEGPVRGALLMGRQLTPEKINDIGEDLHLQIAIMKSTSNVTSQDFQETKANLPYVSSLFKKPVNDSVLVGYTLLGDVLDNPCVILSVSLQRGIYEQGLSMIQSYTYLTVFLFFVFGAIVFLLLERVFLHRLSMLTSGVLQITQSGDTGEQSILKNEAQKKKGDEISVLSKSIGNMLDKIEEDTKSLNKAQRFAGIGELSVMVAHDLRNPLQGLLLR